MLTISILAVLVAAPAQDQRVTSASGVRVRAQPKSGTREIEKVDIGIVLTVLERSPAPHWYRVRTPAKKEGWVYGTLTKPWDPTKSLSIVRSIFEERVALSDKVEFADRVDLMKMLIRQESAATDRATKAELGLLRWRALAFAARAVTIERQSETTCQNWVAAQGEDLAYNEPAGDFIVNADRLWKLATAHRTLPIGDAIAWEAATTDLPGECEGHLPCYIFVAGKKYGRYVELQPNGAHVKEAAKQIAGLVDLSFLGETDDEAKAEASKRLDDLEKQLKQAGPDAAAARNAIAKMRKALR